MKIHIVDIRRSYSIYFGKLSRRHVEEETATPYLGLPRTPALSLHECFFYKGIEHFAHIFVVVVAAGNLRQRLTQHFAVVAGLLVLVRAVVPLLEANYRSRCFAELEHNVGIRIDCVEQLLNKSGLSQP